MTCKCRTCQCEFYPDVLDDRKTFKCPFCGSENVTCTGDDGKNPMYRKNPFYPPDWRK